MKQTKREDIVTHINPAPTEDSSLNTVLHTLFIRVQAELGENFVGAYLQGSSALDAREKSSDVDFLVVVEQDFDDTTMQRIQTIHRELYDTGQFWAQNLEGSYMPRDILKQPQDNPQPVWYIDHGHRDFERSTHDNDCVVRWVTRERGITVAGPPPETLIDPVSTEALRQEVYQVMQTYGQPYITGEQDFKNRWQQSFMIVLFARMLHTLATGEIHSKPAAVQWVQQTLDERWHSVVQQAHEDRNAPYYLTSYAPDPALSDPARAFIRYTIQKSADYMGTG